MMTLPPRVTVRVTVTSAPSAAQVDLSKLNDYIIQNMGTGILVVDGERRLRMMNQAARDLLGTPSPPPGAELRRLSPAVADWHDTHVQPWAPQGGMLQVGERELKPSRHLLGTNRANGVLIFLRDGWGVTEATLGRFFGLHVLVIPIATVVVMLLHFMMIRRLGVKRPL